MALDLGLATHQLLPPLDGVTQSSRNHSQRLADTLERGLGIPADAAAGPPAAARGVPQNWTPLPVDGSHIDVDRPPWTATCLCAATSSTWAAAPSPTAPTVQRADLGRRGRGFVPPFSRRRARRNPDLRPAARRTAHRSVIRAPAVVALRTISCRTFPSCPTRLRPG